MNTPTIRVQNLHVVRITHCILQQRDKLAKCASEKYEAAFRCLPQALAQTKQASSK